MRKFKQDYHLITNSMFWLFILIVAGLIIYNLYEVDESDNKHGDYYIKAPRDKNGNVIRRFDDF